MTEIDSCREWFQLHSKEFQGQIHLDEPLSRHTYYRIGGAAAILAVPKTREDLTWLAKGLAQTSIPFFIMGQGSNLLVSDVGYPGVVIRASRMNLGIDVIEENSNLNEPTRLRLRTGGGVAISSLLRKAAQEGWSGLEFLTGIPGSVGGAVRMNAGTHLGETSQKLLRVEAFSLFQQSDQPSYLSIYQGSDLKFQYRKNLFLPPGDLIWSADWDIERKDPAEVKKLIDETLLRRKTTQPVDYPSCGSVFKNPKAFGISAWQVIERLKLKGHRIGNAQFSEKHSNFIVNLGNAKASDVKGLIDLAKERASRELGIVLEEEVIYLGF